MLTQENYHSLEMNQKYLSVSQVKNYMDNYGGCEASALAKSKGEFIVESNVSMLVGSYVDSHFSGTLDIFKAKNPDIFTKGGTLKSQFSKAEEIINRIERDDLMMKYLSGQQQIIKTGDIDGVPFKIMMDSYHEGKLIVDLKIMRDFKPLYKNGLYVDFITYWGYDIQGAIYREIEGNNLPFVIAVATNETYSDIALIEIPPVRLDMCLNEVKNILPRIMELREGKDEPTRCESCNYCKSTKKLEGIITLEEFQNNL